MNSGSPDGIILHCLPYFLYHIRILIKLKDFFTSIGSITAQKARDLSYDLRTYEIKPVPVVKDLGVLLDTCLSYNQHITETASKCLFKLYQINRIKHLLDRKTLLLVINSFVFSINSNIVQLSRVIPAAAILTSYKKSKTLLDELFWD